MPCHVLMYVSTLHASWRGAMHLLMLVFLIRGDNRQTMHKQALLSFTDHPSYMMKRTGVLDQGCLQVIQVTWNGVDDG